MTGESQVAVGRRGVAGFILLNRPKALNVLNRELVRAISSALYDFERDERVRRVVVQGSGDRAFCAGGDIRWVTERGRAGDLASALAFFREEYTLNARIHRYSKPYVSLIDGIVMGGGVGLSLHGTHRVASERAVLAMPEVGIGFFPDVGATYALPRVPGQVGVAMAATGLRANGTDMAVVANGLGFLPSGVFVDQHFIQRGRFNRLRNLVLQDRSYIGIGISEKTAAIISENGRLEAIGDSQVVLYFYDLADPAGALKEVWLSRGAHFDLNTRSLIKPSAVKVKR